MRRINLQLKKLFVSVAALVLVLSVITPNLAFADDSTEKKVSIKTWVDSAESPIAEQDIKSSGDTVEVQLELESGEWAIDIGSKKAILLDGLKADVEKEKWEAFKQGITYSVSSPDKKILTMEFPKTSYEIMKNQTITANISPVLVENWPGTVQPVSFKIYAKPRISLEGSIMNGTLLSDIHKGGKVIELSLVNATWDKEKISLITNFNMLLAGFEKGKQTSAGWDSAGGWEVAAMLKNTDPNKVVSYSADMRTLKLKLPAFSSAVYNGTISFKLDSAAGLYKIDNIENRVTVLDGSLLTAARMIFNVGEALPALKVTPTELKEEDLLGGTSSNVLTLTLENTQWHETLKTSEEKKKVLINSLVAKDQKEEWEKVKKTIEPDDVKVDSNNPRVVTIKIKAVTDYHLTQDQTINFNIPNQLLENAAALSGEFKVLAQPKALISGTAASVTPTDFIQGGKTVILTLVNAKWDTQIASNTSSRETLLEAFGWNDSIIASEVKARAGVQRTNDTTVTITLPPVTKTPANDIEFDPKKVKDLVTGFEPSKVGGFSVDKKLPAVKFSDVPKTTATVSLKLTGLNEFDIVKGGEQLTLTLKNDIWKNNISKNNIKINSSPSGSSIGIESVTRKSDTVAVVTLAANSAYQLADAVNYDILIGASELVISPAEVKVQGAFAVSPILFDVSGTASKGLEVADIQKGGKTIVITLKNGSFIESEKPTFQQIFGNGTPWQERPGQNDIQVTKNKITIKLPPAPLFAESGKVFNISIPYALISEAPNTSKAKAAGTLTVGAVADVSVIASSLTESDIQKGKANAITLKLANSKWDPNIETVKSKRAALVKGFTTTDQTKEWAAVVSSITENGDFVLSDNGQTVTITLPATPAYSIIRDQTIKVKVPKSVLLDYKYDIEGADFTISVPTLSDNMVPFSEALNDLTGMIQRETLERIRVQVPDKAIQVVTMNTIAIEEGTVTTVEVQASDWIDKITASASADDAGLTQSRTEVDRFVFVFSNLPDNAVIQLAAKDAGDNVYETVYQKVVKGKKDFVKVPKAPLNGSYQLYTLLTDKSLLSEILKYYTLDELKIGTVN